MKGLSKLQELFGELEQLSEDQQGHLIGGFAILVSTQMANFEGTDNCHSGNCTPGCNTQNTNCLAIACGT